MKKLTLLHHKIIKCFKKKEVLIPLFLIFLFVLFILKNAGDWLLISDPVPENIDIIVTFSGSPLREIYSRTLYKQFNKPLWIVNGIDWILDGKTREQYFNTLLLDTIDTNTVLWVDTCKKTLSEINSFRQWLNELYSEKNNLVLSSLQNRNINKRQLSVALVSNPEHMRRIRMMVSKLIDNKNVHFYYIPVPFAINWEPRNWYSNWWLHITTIKKISYEYAAIFYYYFYLMVKTP
jgi:uncharacterized SAM-binding protein YcdF (DUF218 family)